jgi:hypothetical protein
MNMEHGWNDNDMAKLKYLVKIPVPVPVGLPQNPTLTGVRLNPWYGLPFVFNPVLSLQIIDCKQDRHLWEAVANSDTFAVVLQRQGP